MAYAFATKTALIEAFRSLILERGFSKISVGDICERCNMNRKSFYYHFKDKYDIANSCFDADFPYLYAKPTEHEDVLYGLCRYLYENRLQYRRLFDSEGQNSFYDHLRCGLRTYFSLRLTDKSSFGSAFWADAVAFAVKEWICAKNPCCCNDFYYQLISCLRIDGKLS